MNKDMYTLCLELQINDDWGCAFYYGYIKTCF